MGKRRMKVEQKALERLEELIASGDTVLATRRPPPANSVGFDSSVDSQAAYQWFTSSQNILSRVFSETSQHYRNFTAQGAKALTYSPVLRAQGVLKAAYDDLKGGYLFDLRRLVEAEVLDDLLGQADALLAAGYFQPAAVVAGCVLEDTLRKLSERNGWELPERPKLDTMNADLARAGHYTKLTQKRITAIADIRNSAAHGKWDQFTRTDVEDAVSWIRNFAEAQFS
jgi:hypothetical protein